MKKLFKVKNVEKDNRGFKDQNAGIYRVLEPGQVVESHSPPSNEPPFEVEEAEKKPKKAYLGMKKSEPELKENNQEDDE